MIAILISGTVCKIREIREKSAPALQEARHGVIFYWKEGSYSTPSKVPYYELNTSTILYYHNYSTTLDNVGGQKGGLQRNKIVTFTRTRSHKKHQKRRTFGKKGAR